MGTWRNTYRSCIPDGIEIFHFMYVGLRVGIIITIATRKDAALAPLFELILRMYVGAKHRLAYTVMHSHQIWQMLRPYYTCVCRHGQTD